MTCYSAAVAAPGAAAEVLGEMRERAQHRIWRKTPERAKRSELHGLAQILDQRDLAAGVLAGDDRSMVSTPRIAPIRQGVHLPQLSIAQNSKAKRACRAMSTVSSKTTMPPWPISPSLAAKAS